MRLGRTARLAAAALTGGVLAAAAGCSGSGGAGNGTSSGSAPPSRTLAPDPGNGAHPAAAWPTYGHDFARSGVAAGVASPGPLNVSWRVAPGRRGVRPALAGRHDGDRGDRERLHLRTQPGDRQGRLAHPRRHPGAAGRPAVRQHRPARHHRHAGLRHRQWPRVRRGGNLRVPPRPGRRLGPRRQRAGGTRHPRPGRAAAVRPAAARAHHRGRAGVRGVRRAGRRLRSLPRLRGGHPAQRQPGR